MAKKELLLVFAHGIFGWGETPDDTRQNQMKNYYYGVKAFLEDEYGSARDVVLTIVAPTVHASESVEARGESLKQAILNALDTAPAGTRAHIVAHSMGGLDARWVLVQDGMADRIASLTTIATPHRGTTLGNLAYRFRHAIRPIGGFLDRIADLKKELLGFLAQRGLKVDDLLEFYHHLLGNVIDHSTPEEMERGLRALTLNGCEEFNETLSDAERKIRERSTNRIQYFSYGGVLGPDFIVLLKPANDLLRLLGTREEKRIGNDGAVSVWSAHYPWDTDPWADSTPYYQGTLKFDHFMQINWRIPETRPSTTMEPALQTVYREIMERILSLEQIRQ